MNASSLEFLLDGLADAIAARVAEKLAEREPSRAPASERRPDFVSEIEAARRTGLSRRTLQGWRGSGRGPRWVKAGRSVRYPLAELEGFMAARGKAREMPAG